MTFRGVSTVWRLVSSSPSKLFSSPRHSIPWLYDDLTTARMTAFRPGASPPPVSTPIRRTLLIRRRLSSGVIGKSGASAHSRLLKYKRKWGAPVWRNAPHDRARPVVGSARLTSGDLIPEGRRPTTDRGPDQGALLASSGRADTGPHTSRRADDHGAFLPRSPRRPLDLLHIVEHHPSGRRSTSDGPHLCGTRLRGRRDRHGRRWNRQRHGGRDHVAGRDGSHGRDSGREWRPGSGHTLDLRDETGPDDDLPQERLLPYRA